MLVVTSYILTHVVFSEQDILDILDQLACVKATQDLLKVKKEGIRKHENLDLLILSLIRKQTWVRCSVSYGHIRT